MCLTHRNLAITAPWARSILLLLTRRIGSTSASYDGQQSAKSGRLWKALISFDKLHVYVSRMDLKLRRFLVALYLCVAAFLFVTLSITFWRSPYSLTVLIASAYEDGLVVGKNPGKAMVWYSRAAENGDPVAQYKLGLIHFYGRGVDIDRAKGLQWVTESAERGNADAEYFMGTAITAGVATETDFGQAARWFSKAAEQGHVKAQQKLASLYFNGSGVEKDDQEAFKWASRASAQGDAEAKLLLATLYFYGKGTQVDPQHAVKLLTEAANSGNSLAYEMLGASTLHGTGVPKNPSAALQWYTRAAEEGRVNAQFVLGYLYSSGGDVAFNYSLANHWFLKAAKQGSAPAIVALAFHLDNGQGFERNKVKACGLLRVALKHELPNNMAEDLRVQLKEEEKALSAQQLADVSVWEALYSSPKGLSELEGDVTEVTTQPNS